jgi:hypothetical protein
MAGRVSWLIRRARSAARRRGLPFDRAVPVAAAALGALLGLGAGAAVWGAASAWLLEHRAEQALEVSAGRGRDAEAAARVVEELAGEAFQRDWRSQDAREAGLCGSCRLRAEAVRPGGRDDPRHEVVLRCEGRPGRAASLALAAAVRRLLARGERLALLPPGHGEERARQVGEAARLRRERARLEARLEATLAELKPAPDSGPGSGPARQAAELQDVRVAWDEIRRRLAEVESGSAGLAGRVADLERELAGLDGVAPLEASEVEHRRAELVGLDRRMVGANRKDCTDEHPVVRRLAEIARQLRRAELPGEIAGLRRQLEEIERLRGEERSAGQKVRDLEAGRRPTGTTAGAPGTDPEVLKLKEQLTANGSQAAAAEEKLRALDATLPVRIAIQPAGGIAARPPAGGGLVLLLAAALGAALALLLHARFAPGLSLIDDREALAEWLGVPVLGTVPRLGALERR